MPEGLRPARARPLLASAHEFVELLAGIEDAATDLDEPRPPVFRAPLRERVLGISRIAGSVGGTHVAVRQHADLHALDCNFLDDSGRRLFSRGHLAPPLQVSTLT